MYQSTKTYAANLGLSCAFRQWKATHSHCSNLHGYALEVKFVFAADQLNQLNWVMDFGDLGDLKFFLQDTFDHTTLVAADDPELAWFEEAQARGLLKLQIIPDVGCEKFAEYIYGFVEQWMHEKNHAPRCKLVSVEVREHGANSAIYSKE
jgi:6-pyruvoyltetrahydropterin/6-carboxytetrahydropterin synthase